MSIATNNSFQRGSPLWRVAQATGNRLATVRAFHIFLGALIWLCVPLQIIIEPTIENASCTLIAAVTCAVFFQYNLRRNLYAQFPMSALMLLGFNTISFSLPLVVQTIMVHGIVNNLRLPITTFLSLLAVQIVLVIAHIIYVRLSQGGLSNPVQIIYEKLGLFREPREYEFWFLGLVGSVSLLLTRVIYADQIQYGDVGAKFVQALWFLLPAPFAPFVLHYFRPGRGAPSRGYIILTVFYVAALFLVGVGANMRMIMFNSIIILSLGWFLALCSESAKLTNKALVLTLAVGTAAPFAFSTVSDMTAAMAIVRPELSYLSASQRLSRTVDVFFNKNEIRQYREQSSFIQNSGSYTENYTEITVLDRLLIVKFQDNMIYFSGMLSESSQASVGETTKDMLLSILPTPVIQQFVPGFDKNKTQESSFGDILFVMSGGDELTGKKSGSSYVNGWLVLGPAYALFLFVQSMIFFTIFDGFVKRVDNRLAMAPFAFLNLWLIFYGVHFSDSISGIVGLIFRDIPQSILLYAALSYVFNLMVSRVSKRKVVFSRS